MTSFTKNVHDLSPNFKYHPRYNPSIEDGPKQVAALMKLRDQRYEIKPGSTVRDAMRAHDIQPESVIPTRDGELITDDEIIREGDVIRLVAVISGGQLP